MKFKYFAIVIGLASSLLLSCQKEEKLFQKIFSDHSGVDFSNRITESEAHNILNFEYIYNGGGTAIADFNNDSLQDLFFTGNMVNNGMYLNRGDFHFQKITEVAGIGGEGKWCSGSAVVDVNNDGWLDLYVCATTHIPGERRENMLYINQGLNSDGIPVFKDMAEAYGIADTSYTTNAAFFDYDNDGDLDLFLSVNHFDPRLHSNAYLREDDKRISINADKLFENTLDPEQGHPVFEDVSEQAGIIKGGFSLGLNIVDINRDGWKDIYVSNDYLSRDLLLLNNGDKTFTDRSSEYLKHSCYSAMGMNVGDLNNDGLADIFVLDMLPEYNGRRKTMLQPNTYSAYLNNERYEYPYQHVRNVLQLNRGFRPDNGELLFSDVSMYAGIAATDWSWSPVIVDFDHDGYRDFIISNGFPKDITDHDFGDFMSINGKFITEDMSLLKIPSVKLHNYAFKNVLNKPGGIPSFENVSEEWGIKEPSFSSGAAYADLDNDGDIDYVVNNIDDSAYVYKNLLLEKKEANINWLQVDFKGSENNVNGLGAIVEIYYQGQVQMWENTPYRGYHSSVMMGAHFGLSEVEKLDSVRVEWPEGKHQVIPAVPVNQKILLNYEDAIPGILSKPGDGPHLFEEISAQLGVDFKHPESDYIDFNVQRLLMHKLSQYGPGLAVSDVNQDGLDDFYVGGSHFNKGSFFVQDPDGTFDKQDLLPGNEASTYREEELGILFFDADNDQDDDLYLVSGGYEFDISDSSYQDRLFVNEDGKFKLSENALPEFLHSGSCVKAADFDRDGDLDLFVGGRVLPDSYPLPVSSFLLINDGLGKFRMADSTMAPALKDIGLISDALWTDYDNDGWVDLLLAGEWMPLTILKNKSGTFDQILQIGDDKAIGWWNSLASLDFDMDGDMDYVAGNLGSNSLIRTSEKEPVSLYAGDYDNNQSLDLIPTTYFRNEAGTYTEVPFYGRNDMEKQIRRFQELFPEHKDYGEADIGEVMSRLPDVTRIELKANYQLSALIENLGNGDFLIRELPADAQLAPVFAILTGDFTGDQMPDILLTGNDYGNEVGNGRYDALNGLLLAGDGKGDFQALTMQESGILIPGDGKSLVKVKSSDGSLVVVSGQNQGKLGMFRSGQNSYSLLISPFDCAVIVHLENQRSYREEIYYGDSFLSQSARRLWLPKDVKKIELIDYQGNIREVAIE